MKRLLAAASAALFSLTLTASASTLANFGDSLSDGGNVQAATLAGGGSWNYSLYPEGQFTDGATWATQIGLTPSLLGGTNYAYGGARAVDNGDSIPDLLGQIGSYLAGGTDADIATIFVGGNDFLALGDDAGFAEAFTTISNVVGTISAGVTTLALSGVDEILVFGLPDFGLLPQNASDPMAAAEASLLTGLYNDILQSTLGVLDALLPSAVSYFDTDGFFQEVVSMVPADLVSVPCLGDLANCLANPENYLNYDGIHPTDWVHTLLAEAVAGELDLPAPSEVPLPASAPLLLAGLGGLALWRRRRSPA